jgi:NADPH:quinone reductase-like Zn-dependent oxidoreductase
MASQKAIVIVSAGKAVIKAIPVKQPRADQLLVKTKAVGLNPTDWKHIQYLPTPDSIVGCDYAGIVEKVGKDVTGFKVGDRVAGFAHGSKYHMSDAII